MIPTRAEALSLLNKLATESGPFLGFVAGAWGFWLFTGSIQQVTDGYLIVKQLSGLPIWIMLPADASFRYGDFREAMDVIPQLRLPEYVEQVDFMRSLVAGGIVIEYNERSEVVGLIELNEDKLP